MKDELNRRRFLQLFSIVAAGAGLPSGLRASPAPSRAHPEAAPAQVDRGPVKYRKPHIGIQVPPPSWVDEGTEKVLDILQEKGAVNSVWAYCYTYGHERVRADKLPDHGKARGENEEYIGGAFYDYDKKYFQDTILDDFRAPDYGRFNVIEEVLPKVKARGMDFIVWNNNNAYSNIPRKMKNYSAVLEVDVYGRRLTSPCFNKEHYQNFLYGKIENYLKVYPEIDGIAFQAERSGPLLNMIGGGPGATRGFITCFCVDCEAKGRARDISVERARRGFMELDKLFQAARDDQRPTDGYFVSFWRLLLQYPEILAWETLWNDSFHDVRSKLYGTAKAIAPEKPFGFHIFHRTTLHPFARAEENYAEVRRYADFLKPAIYNNAGGPRMVEDLSDLHATVLHDGTLEDFLPLYYKIMNLEEAPFDKLEEVGLSSDYVYRETKRAVEGVNNEIPIYPGIDVDLPQGNTDPEKVKKAVAAAFAGGAQGIILSRRYTEMRLSNLAAAGAAVRALGY